MKSMSENTKEQKVGVKQSKVGAALSKIDIETQLLSSVWSMGLMSIGVVITGIYFWFFVKLFALWYKIFFEISLFASLIFMLSFLVTSYQQWIAVKEVKKLQKENNNNSENSSFIIPLTEKSDKIIGKQEKKKRLKKAKQLLDEKMPPTENTNAHNSAKIEIKDNIMLEDNSMKGGLK